MPVDHNMNIRKSNGDLESTCDGMILYDDRKSIAFVELKDVRTGGAKADAKRQLKNTIVIFLSNHDYKFFNRRFAYIANKRHPHFNFSNKMEMQDFNNKYHFRLLPQTDISLTQGE